MKQITNNTIEKKQFKEYLDMVHKIFNIDEDKAIDFNKLKFLNVLFEHFAEELYSPSSKHIVLRKKYINVTDKFRETLTDEQKEVYEELLDINNEMNVEIEQQLYIFGFIIGCKLKMELEMK